MRYKLLEMVLYSCYKHCEETPKQINPMGRKAVDESPLLLKILILTMNTYMPLTEN